MACRPHDIHTKHTHNSKKRMK